MDCGLNAYSIIIMLSDSKELLLINACLVFQVGVEEMLTLKEYKRHIDTRSLMFRQLFSAFWFGGKESINYSRILLIVYTQ